MKSSLLFIFTILTFSLCFAQNEVHRDSITVSFDYNQSEILDREKLVSQLMKMEVSSIAAIRLIGYTDSTGSLKRNKVLAANRIRSVERVLESSSLSMIKVETVNANELSGFRVAPDELNRRVDLLIYGKNNVSTTKLSFELNKPLNLNINFVGGKAEFLSESYPNLEKLKKLMMEDTTLLLKLHGHVCCDNDMALSVKRAEAVMQYLIRSNIDKKRMSAAGFSNSMELVPDDSEAHMSMNRRVEAIFYRKE
ncbi:MAG: OmpA/MotB domain protein [Fluviicola sp.]|jgi:outer membrane protein OmpA-like peptidoglycan-associated protein|uniref:OmpA family protein n=1 Tax=Fluviicola sp. TaxID=1917219 RepID=UPI0026183FEE|nr:OmpA family protein [Fluviicola sp.]MDF3029313.1 OmpA/MotB domain protein [Fluviicola sp.]